MIRRLGFWPKAVLVIVLLLASAAGVFWLRLSADEAEVYLTTIEPNSNFSSSLGRGGAVAEATPTAPLPDEFIQTTFTPIPTLTNTCLLYTSPSPRDA